MNALGALAPWRQELALFASSEGAALGKLALRLSALLPGLEPEPAENGDLEGYAGITERGTLERLLPSEWAMLGASPAEFLRRAADGEQQFFAPAYRTPQSPRETVVLLDAGP